MPPDTTYRLTVKVELQQLHHGQWSNQGLTVSEQAELNVDSFLDVAGVLGRFHELTNTIRAEQAAS